MGSSREKRYGLKIMSSIYYEVVTFIVNSNWFANQFMFTNKGSTWSGQIGWCASHYLSVYIVYSKSIGTLQDKLKKTCNSPWNKHVSQNFKIVGKSKTCVLHCARLSVWHNCWEAFLLHGVQLPWRKNCERTPICRTKQCSMYPNKSLWLISAVQV